MLAIIAAIENNDDRDRAIQIYRIYYGTMFYIAKSLLHETTLAEDAVSEAFIRVIDNLQKIHTIDCYQTRAFVVIIVRNISLDMIKGRKRAETVPFDDYTENPGLGDSVLGEVTAREACAKIAECIGRLNKNYSDILYLKAQGYDIGEISKILGISRDNAKMRLSRARKALKEELGKEGYSYHER